MRKLSLLLLCAFSAPSWVQAGESPPSGPGTAPKEPMYQYCHARVREPGLGTKFTHYVSGAMPIDNSNPSDHGQAFAGFLAQKYGVQGVGPECVGVAGLEQAQKALEAECTYMPAMNTCVRTGWTYAP
jgi:hypothetical protein